jgi:hypothetical protein
LFLTAREESTKGHLKIRGLKFLALSQTMVIGGKDMYRGGMDIYNSVYWGLEVDLGKPFGDHVRAKESPVYKHR